MQQPNDTKIFTGVMDTDSAPFNINQVDVRYRLNLINLYNDQGFGSNENIVSFLPLFNQFLTTAPQKCLGCFEDVRGNSIIFFIYSADKKHGIYRWYQDKATNGTIEKIYQVQDVNNDCLNFQEDNLISHVSLVDELLIWTDGYNEPRCMNIVRANTTNKQRKFNLYFEPSAFVSAPATTYTLKVYTATTQTFTWVSVSLTYVDRVQDFINAVSEDPTINQYISVENKVNYAQITLTDVGDYMIEVTPSAYVVAENFYPDVTPTTYSYAPLNTELITAVKYPPMCSPKVNYDSTFALDSFSANYITAEPNPQGGLGFQWLAWIGIQNKNNDVNNNVVLGSTVAGLYSAPFVGIGNPNAYITNPTASPILLNINLDITFTTLPNSIVPNSGDFKVVFGKFINNNSLAAGITLYDYNYTSFNLVVDKNFNFNVTINPGEKWVLMVINTFTDYKFNCNLNSFQIPIGANQLITKNEYQFRVKYIYKDNQQSVYGAISSIPLSQNPYQDVINIDFTDDRLSSLELVSDIKEVRVAVSNDNGTTWYDFKTLYPFEFVGLNRQKTTFNAKEILIPIDTAEAILLYHNIPLKSKSQEFIDDRVFYGAITTGYDSVPIDMSIDIKYEDETNSPLSIALSVIPPFSLSYFRRGYEGYLGIVYYDDADRKTGVLLDSTNSKISIPFYTINKSLAPAYATITINHEPPSWATKYQIVKTNDLSASNYLTWATNSVTYVDDNDNTTTPAAGKYLKIDLSNIVFYTDNSNIGTKIDFPYVNGDRLRFIIKSGTTNSFYNYNDFEILRVDGTNVYIQNDQSIVTNYLPSTTGGDLIQLYSSVNITDKNNLVYYEFSQCYEIGESVFNGITKKYHIGNIQNQTYGTFASANTPCILNTTCGDSFYRVRNMPIRVNVSGGTQIISNFFISDNTINDFIELKSNNNGRPNAVDLIGQLYQPTGVVFTNRYISNTKINGLNAVEPANTRQYSTIYGDLNCMRVLNNDILRLIFANGYQLSIYVNQGVIRQSGGATNLISIYDDVAGNSHIIQKSLGTLNAESCVINDEADLFGWDETEGVDWLSASNSLVQVSEYKMMNVFNDYGQTRRQLDRKKSHTPAVYDLSRDLMVLTLNPLQPKPYIAPSFIVKLPDINSTADWQYGIDIHPNNASYYEFNPTSTSWYDLFTSSLAQLGQFTLTQNADGSFKVEAPSFVGYNNSVLVLSAYNKVQDRFYTYSYSFLGGQQASSLPAFDGVTIAYNRKQQGWQTYFSFIPEMYGRLRNQIVSFDNGVLYLHDKGVGYNNFYGQQYVSKINFILNKDYPKVKTPLSLWYRGYGNWSAKVGYSPNNMETEMLPANWRLQENGYSTEILRDRNDPAFTNPLDAWVNGQEIRGDYIEIELSIDSNQFAAIDSEKTIYTYSEIS